MKTHQILSLLFIIMAVHACSKGDSEPKPDADYSGTLTLVYARSFPEFSATVTMDVQIYKSGDVLISDPDQVPYSGEDEMELGGGAKVKLNETGTVTVTSLEGFWKVIGGGKYLRVNANTLIDGTEKIWGWDDDLGWILVGEDLPFTIEDPVESPMDFNILEAVMGGGSVLGNVVNTEYGSLVYTWTLLLAVDL